MTMNVDSKRIRAEREKRAWSQEHLASVAGVSLRTIQRVEGTGVASYDTAQAVAAVFGIDVAELRVVVVGKVAPEVSEGRGVEADADSARAVADSAAPVMLPAVHVIAPALPPPPPPAARPARRYWGVAASLALVVAALFGGRVAYAQQQVQLDVGLAINEQQFGPHTLIVGEGKDAEIRLEGKLKLVVVPSESDGNIAMSIRMYEYVDDAFSLVGEPRLLAADNDEVELKVTSKRGNVFRVAIKPHRLEPGAPPPRH